MPDGHAANAARDMVAGDIERRVASRWATLVPRQSSVLVAVSGGGDSTALLHLLRRMTERLGIRRIGVLHVNHKLRGEESDDDERFVARVAGDLECPFFLKTLSGRSLHSAGMEAWAREERYRFFLEVKERENYTCVATGHTADDQAETVLSRLWRGTGLRGMRGILPARADGVVRPLVDLRRNEIIAWLGANALPFRSDSSNRDYRFLRNRIRCILVPLIEQTNPQAVKQLIGIAEAMQELWARFEPGIDRWIGTYSERVTAECFRVRKEGFDEFLALEGLRSVFDAFSIPVDASHLDDVARHASRSSGCFLLGGAWRYYPRRSDMLFCNESPEAPGEFCCPLKVPGTTECPGKKVRFIVTGSPYPEHVLPSDNFTVVLDGEACGTTLIFRSWRKGDAFDPLGSAEKVAVKDFLAKQKYPSIVRSHIGVVEGRGGSIVWIPGVRISNHCRITPGTGKCITISCRPYSSVAHIR